MEWKYGEKPNTIVLDEVPKRKKKITGTRFASVLGLNPYQTPFGAWCEIVGLAKLPFEDNKYTIAGKTIEPKQIAYLATKFPNIMSPEQYFGAIYEEKKYDFYNDKKIFGGMWDVVSTKMDRKTIAMHGECKTSSKPQDWNNNNVPTYYLCQGMLYVYLDNLDKILFIASFLQDIDYAHPENYVVDEKNTVLIVKNLNDTYIDIQGEMCYIENLIKKAMDWWEMYVETGISPMFDEVKDKEYLDIIRASQPKNDMTLEGMCNEALGKAKELETLKESSGVNKLDKELKKLETNIKETMIASLKENETSAKCGKYSLKGTFGTKFNEDMFAEKHQALYNEFCENTITYKLTKDLKDSEEQIEKGEKKDESKV